MKHLKIFETKNAFDTEKASLNSPCVALTEDDTNIHIVYTTINEDDLTKGDFIDLGLPSGLKWASCNLGATKPCGYGDYYQWGSATPNTNTVCDGVNYKHCDINGFTKYNSNEEYGKVDNKTVLDPTDDAAYVATNGKAHIPTQAQCQELLDNTTSEWVNCTYLGSDHADHTVMGRKFTSKTNGNSIFIPAAGIRINYYFEAQGINGYVWSSSLSVDSSIAYILAFFSDDCTVGYTMRSYGIPVRPVSV